MREVKVEMTAVQSVAEDRGSNGITRGDVVRKCAESQTPSARWLNLTSFSRSARYRVPSKLNPAPLGRSEYFDNIVRYSKKNCILQSKTLLIAKNLDVASALLVQEHILLHSVGPSRRVTSSIIPNVHNIP